MAKTVVEIFDRYASRYDSWYEWNKIIAENEVKLVKNNINWRENSVHRHRWGHRLLYTYFWMHKPGFFI